MRNKYPGIYHVSREGVAAPPGAARHTPPSSASPHGRKWLEVASGGPRAAQGVSGLNYVNELKLFSVQSGKHSHYKAADTAQSDGHGLAASSYRGAANLTAGRRRGEGEAERQCWGVRCWVRLRRADKGPGPARLMTLTAGRTDRQPAATSPLLHPSPRTLPPPLSSLSG